MRILINNHEVDFNLENEKTLDEVITSLQGWASERGLIMMEVHLEGKTYQPEAVPAIALSDAGDVNCVLESQAEMIFSTAGEGISWCARAIDFIDKCEKSGSVNDNDTASLADGTEWLAEVIVSVLHLLTIDPDSRKYRDATIAHYVEALELFTANLREGGTTLDYVVTGKDIISDSMDILKFLLSADEMRRMVVEGIESPDALMETLHTMRDSLETERDNLSSCVMAFQAGRDAEGAERLNVFIEFVYRYSRTCAQIPAVFSISLADTIRQGTSLEVRNQELQGLLSQVLDAMENDDIITLADVLEYEIIPLFGELEEYLDILREKLSS